MTDKELENISTQLIKKCVADSIGRAAIDPKSIEDELNKMNAYKAHLLINLQTVDEGIAIINSFKNKGENNDRN